MVDDKEKVIRYVSFIQGGTLIGLPGNDEYNALSIGKGILGVRYPDIDVSLRFDAAYHSLVVRLQGKRGVKETYVPWHMVAGFRFEE